MKKRIAIILIGTTVAALAAGCGNRTPENTNPPAASQETGTTVDQNSNTEASAQNQSNATGSAAQGQNNGAAPAAQGQNNGAAPAAQGQSNAGTGISEEEAKNIALTAAGVSETDTISLVVKQDYDDGFQLYEVSVYTPTQDYEYDINMADGTILKQDMEYVDQVSSIKSQTAVTPEDAKNTALKKVSGAEDRNIRMKLDRDDGRYVYEGEIILDNTSYDFEIDAQTGEIFEWSQEALAY